MTYREAYELGRAVLGKAGVEEAALDARLLLEFVCGTNRNDLLVHGDREIEQMQEKQFRALIGGRSERIPLQHLTGVQEFMGLEFQINDQVLIPRQDTEILVEEVLRELQDGMRILDLCTGSGCILISLLYYSNGCEGLGVDISQEALKLARKNAERLLGLRGHMPDCSGLQGDGPVAFRYSDLLAQVTGTFDVIVSNPPYIPSGTIPTLMPEVGEHEPMLALDGGEDGLFFYRKIVQESPAFLEREGRLYLEIGYDQAEAVRQLLLEAGFAEIRVVKDYAGLDRVVCASWFGRSIRR